MDDDVNVRTATERRILLSVAIIITILYTFGLYDQYLIDISSYEYSVYENLSPMFLLGLISCFIYGTILIFYYILINKNKIIMNTGIALILQYFITLISLISIRGYFLWCVNGDPSTHIGYMKYIVEYGHIPRSNFYPILHTLGAELNYVVNFSMSEVSIKLPILFGIIFLIFIYILTRFIIDNNGGLIALVIGGTAIGGWYLNFTPNSMANLLFPVVIYILYRTVVTKNVKWILLLLLFIIIYPLMHVLASISLTIFIVSIYFVYKHLMKNDTKKIFQTNEWIPLALVSSIWIITWTTSFYLWQVAVINIKTLLDEGGVTELDKLTEQSFSASSLGYDPINYLFLVYGPIILLTIITIYMFIIVYNKRLLTKNLRIFSLVGPFISMIILVVVLLFANLGFGPLRFVYYIFVISTICSSYLLLKITDIHIRWKRVISIGFTMGVFAIIFILGFITLFPSPITYSDNWQSTEHELSGMKWFFSERDFNQNISGYSIAPGRYAQLIFNSIDFKNQNVSLYLSREFIVPNHFGYDFSNQIDLRNISESYLIINDADKNRYMHVLPEIASIRFETNDFKKLSFDPTLDRIYSANGLEVYLMDKN